jgi:alpha-L-fucosidase 2
VRVKSLAGEPCRIRPSLEGEVKATSPMNEFEPGLFDLKIAKGEEAFLYTGNSAPDMTVAPVAADSTKLNYYGLKKK